jgi:hypothetical protein
VPSLSMGAGFTLKYDAVFAALILHRLLSERLPWY